MEILGLGLFRSIFRTTLLPVRNPCSIKGPANNMISDTGKIFNTPSPNQHNRMLLEIMANSRNISRYLEPVRHPDTSDLSQGRVRFFRGSRIHPDTHTPPLRAASQCGAFAFFLQLFSTTPNKLINRRHELFLKI